MHIHKKILSNTAIILAVTITNFATAQSAKYVPAPNRSALKGLSTSAGRESHPFFVDIDNDGDMDCFSGEFNYNAKGNARSCIDFFRNEGDKDIPAFRKIINAANPLNSVALTGATIPYFIDINADGAYDCFIGTSTGAVIFYKNAGTAIKPIFEKKSAAENPLTMIKYYGTELPELAFADVDKDGDYDCLVTDREGNENFFKNTGSATKPTFTYTAGNADPFRFLKNRAENNASFYDFDKDGNTDLFAGNIYYRNTGTSAMPIFKKDANKSPEIKTGDDYNILPLRWIDINNDGNAEIVKGNNAGSFDFLTASPATDAVSTAQLQIYPNPSRDQFTLTIPGAKETACIRVTDAQGKTMLLLNTTSRSITFGKTFKAGMYIVTVSRNNHETGSQKIIRQ